MILISTTHQPATDLGFLLHKHPDRIFEREATFGRIIVAYPEANEERTTAALVADVDPVKLSRKKGSSQGAAEHYVNDRPYTANSFLAVALLEAFRTTMIGQSKDRQDLAETPIPLEIRIPVIRAANGEEFIRRLFEPLGYSVACKALELDNRFPEWGASPYFDVTISGTLLIRDALRHLYILIPVLDSRKHYYMDTTEVNKIISKGEGWLAHHPEKNTIIRGFMGRRPSLVREALAQVATLEADMATEEEQDSSTELESSPEEPRTKKQSLHAQRHARVVEVIQELRPRSVIDLGCGEGKLIQQLIPIQGIERIVGLEVSYRTLERATRRLNLEEGGSRYRDRVELIHGSLMYRDSRIAGFDVATVIEVIEHMDQARLNAFEKVLFQFAQPQVVFVTTPNREYNVLYNELEIRHEDHRFEWTRAEFQSWANEIAERHGYSVRIEGIGENDEVHGSPSQMGVFTR